MPTYRHPAFPDITAEIDDADDAAAKGWLPVEPPKASGVKPGK